MTNIPYKHFSPRTYENTPRGKLMKLHFVIMAALLLIGSVQSETLIVCPSGCNYTKIQAAVDAAQPGDIVEVHSGTYYENVYISEGIVMHGMDTGMGKPVVDAGLSGSVITLYADGIALDGFNVTNSGTCGCGNAGIKIMSNKSTIFDNTAYKNKYGIYCGDHIGNTLYQNNLVENEISAFDGGINQWYENAATKGIVPRLAPGLKAVGNHYSDYDRPGQGCNDTNGDGICDLPYKIRGGSNVDNYPSTSRMAVS
jgi:parallel beta-helix repeat protein